MVRAGAINPFPIIEERIKRSIDYQNEDVIELATKALNVERYTDVLNFEKYSEARGTKAAHYAVKATMSLPPIDNIAITEQNWLPSGDFLGKQGFPALTDPVQNSINDCGTIATLTALVWVKPGQLLASENINGERQFSFFNSKNGTEETVQIKDTLMGRIGVDNKPSYEFVGSNGGSWPCLFEKAYAKWLSNKKDDAHLTPDDFHLLEYQKVDEVLRNLTGLSTSNHYLGTEGIQDTEGYLLANCQKDLTGPGQQTVQQQPTPRYILPLHKTVNMMVAVSRSMSKEIEDAMERNGIPESHAFTVLGYLTSGYVVLRNPWGKDVPITKIEEKGKDDTPADRLDGTFAYYEPGTHRVEILKTAKEDGIFALKLKTFHELFSVMCIAYDPDVTSKTIRGYLK